MHRERALLDPRLSGRAPRDDIVRTLPAGLRAWCAALCVTLAAAQIPAQSPQSGTTETMRRVEARIAALEREADRLAGAARTLIVELRKLEVERDLRLAEAARAEASLVQARRALEESTGRLATLERERIEQLPALRVQLIELYKRGPVGFAQLLFSAADLREFGRASRAVAALADLNRRRIEEHRGTVAAMRRERLTNETRLARLESEQAAAAAARVAAERAVAAHAARMAEIDTRRDLTAQYVGELRAAREGLERTLAERAKGRSAAAPVPPLAPFRGALEWPAPGRLVGGFGRTASRLGGSAVRNGIEIAAPAGTPVRAVHGGTVAYADAFTGFGTLVILDHGSGNFSLYGYLGGATVSAGQTVTAGAEVGQVGASPAGPTALYFELRIDGRAIDPVQWLEPR